METVDQKIILQGITVEDFFSRLEKQFNVRGSLTETDEVLTVHEASHFLKISIPTLHRLKAKGKVPFKKIGARVVYQRSELTKWLSYK